MGTLRKLKTKMKFDRDWHKTLLRSGKDEILIDIDGDKEAAILAAADGTVEEAEYSAKKGYYLRIRHGNGLETLYAHCSSLLAEEGDSVSAGEQVAVMGSTGYSTGPHCHFEVLVNGQSVDPLSYLPTAE